MRAAERIRRLPLAEARELREAHREGRSPSLVSAKLKLVDACNLRCFMCDYWKGRREGELGTEEVFRVLGELAALGCEKVHFTGGELFLRKDALDLFRRAAELGMRVNLTTNGTLLDKGLARALAEIPVRSVTLSVDSPVAEIHDAVRGRKGAHRKTTRALDHLLRYRSKKTRVRVNTVVSARNFLSLVEMPAYLEERPVDGWLLIPMDDKPGARAEGPAGAGSLLDRVRRGAMPGEAPRSDALTEGEIAHYDAFVAPLLAEGIRVPGFDPFVFGRGEAERRESARGRYARGRYRERACHVPFFHTLVGARGDVYPCCMMHRQRPPLGSVHSAGLGEIFGGEAYRTFRLGMLEVREEICHRCDDFLEENAAIDAALSERGLP